MPPDKNDVIEPDKPLEPKSEIETYMDYLINEESYSRRKARRKAERKYGKDKHND